MKLMGTPLHQSTRKKMFSAAHFRAAYRQLLTKHSIKLTASGNAVAQEDTAIVVVVATTAWLLTSSAWITPML